MDEIRDYLANLISCKHAIFKYEGFPKVPRFVVYGVIRSDENYLEIDDETEEFFKSLIECLLRVGGGCLNENPWHMKSPLINYGSYYMVRCRANQPKEVKGWSILPRPLQNQNWQSICLFKPWAAI